MKNVSWLLVIIKLYREYTRELHFDILTYMKIYFAGSIRGGREDSDLYAKIIESLQNFGEVLTEHVGKKTLSEMGEEFVTEEYIYNRDMQWLKEADVVVAEITTVSMGVGYELGWADGKKPILALYRSSQDKKLSAMINGSPTIIVKNYQTLDEAKLAIEAFIDTAK